VTRAHAPRQVFRVFDCRKLDSLSGDETIPAVEAGTWLTLFELPHESWHKDKYDTDCETTTHQVTVYPLKVTVYPLNATVYPLTVTTHQLFRTAAFALTAVYPLGVPLFMYAMLFRNRKWLSNPDNVQVGPPPAQRRGGPLCRLLLPGSLALSYYMEGHMEDCCVRDLRCWPRQPPADAPWYVGNTDKFEFLVRDYKPEYYYWEVVEMIRKLLLTGMIIFVDAGSTAQVFVACVVSFFFFSLQMACMPYEQPGNNHLKVAAEIQTFLTLLVSIVLRSSLEDEIIQEDGYGLMLVVVNLSLALPLFVRLRRGPSVILSPSILVSMENPYKRII
jgi:hypothetical protein